MKFRKKPVVIEAVQWTGSNVDEVLALMLGSHDATRKDYVVSEGHKILGGVLQIHTREGVMDANPNDWIIRGVKGEFYPCKPDIFAATYEPVSASKEEPK